MIYGGDEAWLDTLPPEAPAVADEPELWPENVLYMRAFLDLSCRRPWWGMGSPGMVPVSEIESWCRVNGVTDAPRMVQMVAAADVVFVQHINDKAKRDRDQRQQQR